MQLARLPKMNIALPFDADPSQSPSTQRGQQELSSRESPQRILIVTDAWSPQVNGVVRSYESIIRELQLIGHEVAVISPQDFRRLPLPGYREIALALVPYRSLAGKIADFAPDRIHIAVEGPLGWAARRYCLRHRMPYSTAFHTNFPAYIALRAPSVLRKPLHRITLALLRRFHGRAQYTFVATPSIAEQLRDWGFAGQLRPLSRGVDADVFYPPPDAVRNDMPVLLYVGRVAPEKNLDAFLSLTPGQTGPARKIVVGDGPALGALRRAYPDVAFCGTLTGQSLGDIYRLADVFVFPSRTDTFGIVMIEALASGLPIAAYNVPGPCDIVTEPSLGALDDDLGRAIRRALAAPGNRKSRSERTYRHYSWKAVAQSFLDY